MKKKIKKKKDAQNRAVSSSNLQYKPSQYNTNHLLLDGYTEILFSKDVYTF